MPQSTGFMLNQRHFFTALGSEAQALTLLLLSFACIVLPHFQHIPVWASGLALFAFGLKLWLMRQGVTAPNQWVLSTFAALAGVAVLAEFKTLLGREAGVTLLVILGCVKLLELRARRDLFVAFFLAFFLALCQFLFSQNIGTALLVFSGITLLFVALIAQQMTVDSGEAPPSLRTLVALTLRMYAFALPMSLAAFLLFPRFGPLWGTPDTARGTTGMSETMSPGSVSQLAESDAITFRVRFDKNSSGQRHDSRPDNTPAAALRYWRVMVLGRFDGRTWRQHASQPEEVQQTTNDRTVRYTITLEPDSQRWLPVLDLPVAQPIVTGTQSYRLRNAHGAYQLEDKTLRERVQIQAVSAFDAQLGREETPFTLQRWLELPLGANPRTLTWANEWRERYAADSAEKLVQRLLQFFHEQPFRYTLEPPPLGLHSADEFLFNTRAGFCEHYSSAFVIMMRALGIPARVVIGYQGGEVNPVDGYLVVRQRDAHAWAEVWLAQRGWVRIDPTAAVAPERIERGAARALPRPDNPLDTVGNFIGLDRNHVLLNVWKNMRQYADAINNRWNQWVIAYHRDGQIDFLKNLGFEEPDWSDLLLSLMASIALISGAMAWRLFARREKLEPMQRLYARFEKKLRQVGIEREPHEAPLAFQQRALSLLDPVSAQQAEKIFRAWIKLRYAGHTSHLLTQELNLWIAAFHPPSSR